MRKKQELARRAPVVEVKPSTVPTVLRRDIKTGEKFCSVYVNDVEVQTSTWDIRLLLGEIGDAVVDGSQVTVSVTRLCEVRMSPQLAKKLTLILADQLKSYEMNFGQIPSSKE